MRALFSSTLTLNLFKFFCLRYCFLCVFELKNNLYVSLSVYVWQQTTRDSSTRVTHNKNRCSELYSTFQWCDFDFYGIHSDRNLYVNCHVLCPNSSNTDSVWQCNANQINHYKTDASSFWENRFVSNITIAKDSSRQTFLHNSWIIRIEEKIICLSKKKVVWFLQNTNTKNFLGTGTLFIHQFFLFTDKIHLISTLLLCCVRIAKQTLNGKQKAFDFHFCFIWVPKTVL